MVRESPGVTLVGGRCRECFGPLTTVITQTGYHAWLSDLEGAIPDVPFRNRYGIEFKRTIWHAQACQDCRARQNYEAKVMGKPKEKPEVRQDIVDAIRRLKTSGWKFPWEAQGGLVEGDAEVPGDPALHRAVPQEAEAAP